MEFWPRSWKFMEFHVGKFVCSRAAYCSGLSDIYAGGNIKLRQYVKFIGTLEYFRDHAIPYSETVLSPLRFNINCTRQVAAHLLRCVVSSFFIRCSLQIEPIVNRVTGVKIKPNFSLALGMSSPEKLLVPKKNH